MNTIRNSPETPEGGGSAEETPSDAGPPEMEMHGIRKNEVILLIEGQGGIIVDIQEDASLGETWKSYRYCFTK
jgi:dethiobiotin synthetase